MHYFLTQFDFATTPHVSKTSQKERTLALERCALRLVRAGPPGAAGRGRLPGFQRSGGGRTATAAGPARSAELPHGPRPNTRPGQRDSRVGPVAF